MHDYVALISAGAAALVSVASVLISRRQTLATAAAQEATAADVTVSTALELLDPLRARIKALEEKVEGMCKEMEAQRELVKDLEEGHQILTAQIVDLGHEPAWP